MKRILIYSFISFIIFTSFTSKKTVQDYRNIYEGSYFCIRNCQVVNSERTGLVMNKDTITIRINKDPTDSVLNILFDKFSLKVKLKDGKVYAYPSGHWSGKFFASDSLVFSLSVGNAANICSYSGKKK